MRAPWLLPLAVALFCGCVERELKDIVVETGGASAVEARRAAVSGLCELFVSSSALAANRAEIDEKIIAHAADFIAREKMILVKGSPADTRLSVMVSLDKLGRALDDLGLVKPEGVAGRPQLLVRVIESGPGSGNHAASEAMRRALAQQGYFVVDLSSETKAAANAKARALKSGALIQGDVESRAAPDPRLVGFQPAAAKISVRTVAAPGPEALEEVEADASSIDATLAAAGAKAMSAAGEIAAAKLRQVLGSRYRERVEMSALFVGLGGLEAAKKLIADLRAQPFVAGAALDSIVGDDARARKGDDVKIRIFVENPSVDELASELMKLPKYAFNIRDVEADYRYVEMDASGGHWHAL